MKQTARRVNDWRFGRQRRRLIIVGLLIAVVGLSHWLTPVAGNPFHVVHVSLRKLFILPIVLAAIWFEFRGAIIAAAVVTIVYLPHVFLQWSGNLTENVNQMGEVATAWIIALLSGFFVRIEKTALRETARTHEGSLVALVAALDAREHETQLHSLRVRAYALRLGAELGMNPDQMRVLGQASLLHDIGKVGTPDPILLKPGPLTDEEWEMMRRHPEVGQRILLSVPFLRDSAKIVYSHHEHYDGTGYPKRLSGDQIPFGSRVFAIADAFDALTSDRPYRKRVSCGETQRIIKEDSGKHFDPEAVRAFLRISCAEWEQIDREVAAAPDFLGVGPSNPASGG
ncbi:MAG: HD domain-containing protein [Actinobacteria bacterium]|nr:HD domain-containing protein [Actinomycetota bacterium]